MKRRLLFVFLALLVAGVAWSQSLTDDSGTNFGWVDSGTITTDTNVYWLDDRQMIDRVELVDGDLHVWRQGGMYCGGSLSCAVNHPIGFDHCSPYKEVYGARDGEVVLLRTIEPEIIEATQRQVIWPEP